MTEDKMVGWHHQFNGREFEQTLEDSNGQGSLACCSPWGFKELDMTEHLNNNNILLTNVHIVKAMVFLIVMYSCENWSLKKVECQRTDAFKLWCWKRLLRVT